MVHFLGNQSFDNLLEVEPSERESGLKGKWFLNFIRHNKVNGTQNKYFDKSLKLPTFLNSFLIFQQRNKLRYSSFYLKKKIL